MYNDLVNELSQNFIEYAVAVNSDRSIPDSKSGLKPVARRILFGSLNNGYTSNKAHVKCAKIVGDVMGQLHPHGDSSIYGALVRLAQPWIMRYPLMDFHGNMGNIGGDGPAAYRYTEARLSKLSEEGLLSGLKKNNVDFIPNYDETIQEPITLPAIFPNLLCNPNSGIGVAMACNWAPHNLKEVAAAINNYLEGKEPSLPGPDFPTGGVVINKNDIPAIMASGKGSVKIRGKYNIEKQNIVFTEIPFGTSIEGLITEIGKCCDEKEIEGVEEVRNESSKKKIRIVIECEKGVAPEKVVNKLFSKTNLQTSFSYNQVALVDKTPTELNLKDCIKIYINHNLECLRRELSFDLQKAKERLEIVEGLLKALEDIDNIIALIKKSESAAAAKVSLIEKYAFTENQAKAILAMRLSSLARLEKIELNNEKDNLKNTCDSITKILASEDLQKEEIQKRLNKIVEKYGDDRRTELTQIDIKPEEKEVVEVIPEDVVVIATKSGDIKRVPRANFKIQQRNGKGIKSNDDVILETISTNTIDTLMIFTNKGKMYRLLVDKVPVGTNSSKGQNLNALINFEKDEIPTAITSLHRKTNAKYVVFFTKKGLIKKTPLEEYMNTKKTTGIQAIKFKEDDELVDVTFLKDEPVFIVSKAGYSIKFETEDITPVGRIASGVKAIKLGADDYVIAGMPISPKKTDLAIFTKNGLGKKTSLSEYPMQARGGKGVLTYKPNAQTGDIAGIALINDSDKILLIGTPSSICISSSDIPAVNRIALGNNMVKDSKINKVVKL